MATLDIIEYPHPLLRQVATPVTEFGSELRTLVSDLTDTLYSTTGIGLSAPQVARSLQIMVMDLSDDQSETQVLINPQIISKAGFAIADESCLSIPGVSAKVIRSNAVLVRSQDQTGASTEREFQGMYAICIQHEIDHMQGKLFIDRVSRLRSLGFRKSLRALERDVTATACTTA